MREKTKRFHEKQSVSQSDRQTDRQTDRKQVALLLRCFEASNGCRAAAPKRDKGGWREADGG